MSMNLPGICIHETAHLIVSFVRECKVARLHITERRGSHLNWSGGVEHASTKDSITVKNLAVIGMAGPIASAKYEVLKELLGGAPNSPEAIELLKGHCVELPCLFDVVFSDKAKRQYSQVQYRRLTESGLEEGSIAIKSASWSGDVEDAKTAPENERSELFKVSESLVRSHWTEICETSVKVQAAVGELKQQASNQKALEASCEVVTRRSAVPLTYKIVDSRA